MIGKKCWRTSKTISTLAVFWPVRQDHFQEEGGNGALVEVDAFDFVDMSAAEQALLGQQSSGQGACSLAISSNYVTFPLLSVLARNLHWKETV